MNRKLYLFNPDHDLALANGGENFNAPISARSFAVDLACLPVWYAAPGGVISGALQDKQWFESILPLFPQLEYISVEEESDLSTVESVLPWGWNAVVCKALLMQGIDNHLLPDRTQLEDIRRLSHRSTAIRAMEYLHKDKTLAPLLPPPAQLLTNGEVCGFAAQFPQVVFKAPWSGSGKGLYWVSGAVPENIQGWCRKVAKNQGGIIGEAVYDKVQDFAMEFACIGKKAAFAGYSLFTAEHGVYRSNELMSDDAIFEMITQQWISANDLLAVRNRLLTFIDLEIAPVYEGFLGVDMFVFQNDGRFLLHSCVEINLRMTMGMVARIFYDQFVQSPKTGRFYVDYFPSTGSLWNDHLQRQSSLPLQLRDGRITQGYLSLAPITEHSHYRIRVEIDNP